LTGASTTGALIHLSIPVVRQDMAAARRLATAAAQAVLSHVEQTVGRR
jgi:hypothetical protein